MSFIYLFIFYISEACELEHTSAKEASKKDLDLQSPVKEDPLIPTPQAPSIAFPLANPPVAPQPKEMVRFVLWYHLLLKFDCFLPKYMTPLSEACLIHVWQASIYTLRIHGFKV